MTTISDQLAWERGMVDRGASRFRAQQERAVTAGRGAETSAGGRLLREYVLQVADHIADYTNGRLHGRKRGAYAGLLGSIDADKVAMLTLRQCITAAMSDVPRTLQTTISTIGQMIEDELKFSVFQLEHDEYYSAIVRNYTARNSTNYRYRHRVLAHGANEKGISWEDWSRETRFGVGALAVALMMEATDLIEKVSVRRARGRVTVTIAPTQECMDWIMRHNETVGLTSPDRMPCIVPPEDWTAPDMGGYYSPRLRGLTPLVKGLRHDSEARRRELIEAAHMPEVLSAVNAMQRTAWTVNYNVLSVMQDVWRMNLGTGMPRSQPVVIPQAPVAKDLDVSSLSEDDPRLAAFKEWKAEAGEMHRLERERVSKNLALVRTLRLAGEMLLKEEFYYVYQCDFRGRVYAATAGLSPQGTDHGKSLLQFAEKKPLGEHGLYWLKVHGANKYGEDHASYDARVAWIEARHEQWIAVANDPIEHRGIWGEADKPYQFLAFCFEYAEADRLGEDFRSCLPVALDGSCNGLQHFSAMLRDEVGGGAVNLTPCDEPADIYQEVADVCTTKLKTQRSAHGAGYEAATNWLGMFASLDNTGERMPRALSKKPVMTLPYGSTQQACTQSVFSWVKETAPEYLDSNTTFTHAIHLSPLLWDSIGEVVVAARRAMSWIQECTSILAKAGRPLSYVSPLGFPVHSETFKYTTRKISTQIGGRLQLRLSTDTDVIDTRKQRQGSSPNLVHHVDATHMMMCINAGVDEGIGSFAMIHDDFGVHACNVEVWHNIIREQFVRLHTEHDILAEFKRVHEFASGIELPAPPKFGALDIQDVLKSPYFFG